MHTVLSRHLHRDMDYAAGVILKSLQDANIKQDEAAVLGECLNALLDKHVSFISQLREYLNQHHSEITRRPPRAALLGESLRKVAMGDLSILAVGLDRSGRSGRLSQEVSRENWTGRLRTTPV